ncbi:hypothetical protein D3C81_2103660 [compost metagenome]
MALIASQASTPSKAKVALSRYSPQCGAPCGIARAPLVKVNGTPLKPLWVGSTGSIGQLANTGSLALTIQLAMRRCGTAGIAWPL